MNPFGLISSHLPTTPSTTTTTPLLDAPGIAQLRGALGAMLSPLGLFLMTEPQRTALSNKDAPDLRKRSRADLRLLRRRPTLAQRAGLTPAVYQQIVERDEGVDVLAGTLTELRARLRGALLAASARFSARLRHVLQFADPQNPALRADPDLRAEVATAFMNTQVVQAQADNRAQGREQRKERARKPLIARLEQAESEIKDEASVSRLLKDAGAAADVTLGEKERPVNTGIVPPGAVTGKARGKASAKSRKTP